MHAGTLSHGLRRRVELARALALDPRFIILDEPASGLDDGDADSLASTLQALAATGIGFLIIDHNMDFLLPLAERLACLQSGRMIAIGPVSEVRNDPRVIEAYLGASLETPQPDASAPDA